MSLLLRCYRQTWVAILSLLLAGQASAVTIEHEKGSHEFKTTPKRVVVLGMGSLDVLDRLGIKPVGTPHSLLPEHLKKYAKTTLNTGNVSEPDFEAVFSMKPDVIIAENRMLPLYDELDEIAPTVMFYIQGGNYWEDAKKNWRMMGALFDKQVTAEEVISGMEQQLKTARGKAQKAHLSALMLMNNGNNLAMFNKGSRFSIIFDEFGFNESSSQKVAPVTGSHGNLISFEYVADANPDVIFVLDREQAIGKSAGKAQVMFDNPLVNKTQAAKNQKMVFVDPNSWYIAMGGMTATETMINDINQALN